MFVLFRTLLCHLRLPPLNAHFHLFLPPLFHRIIINYNTTHYWIAGIVPNHAPTPNRAPNHNPNPHTNPHPNPNPNRYPNRRSILEAAANDENGIPLLSLSDVNRAPGENITLNSITYLKSSPITINITNHYHHHYWYPCSLLLFISFIPTLTLYLSPIPVSDHHSHPHNSSS